jgi:hypothetical protein
MAPAPVQPPSSEEIGVLSWLWNVAVVLIGGVMGALAGWFAFVGATRARLNSLEARVGSIETIIREEVRELRTEARADRVAATDHFDHRFGEISAQINTLRKQD